MATFSPNFSDAPDDASRDAATASDALIIFCRAPRLGEVKTRLARSCGDDFALQLYRAMLRDCFDLGRTVAPQTQTFACYTPADAFDENGELRALWNGPAFGQRGADLGARMLNALREARARGFGRAVIIGSDAPDLPLAFLREAFELLRENAVVVGPSGDGGFVLLGVSRPVPDAIFAGITWSSAEVCVRLLDNLRAFDFGFALLSPWHDVDDAADLDALSARLQNDAQDVARATRAVLDAQLS